MMEVDFRTEASVVIEVYEWIIGAARTISAGTGSRHRFRIANMELV